MTFDIVGAAVDFVTDTTNRVISAFINQTLVKENKINLPVRIQKLRQDHRVIQAEVDYYNRREARKKEFLQIQQSPLSTDIEITFTADEREKKLIQLKREEMQDRGKLSALYLNLSRETTSKAIELKQKEIQGIFDQQKWPGVLSRDEAQRIFVDEQKKPRLLILIPPPDISEDFPISFRDSLKKEIRNQLKLFLEKYYPIHSDFCPVEFYGKYFERSIFDAEVKQLETILSAVPTAIIYTDITDHEVYFNVKFWGLHEPVSLSFEPWNWEEVKGQLEDSGSDETKSLRAIRHTIVILHKLLAAFLADWYYLNINPNYEPQLFKLSADFPSVWTSEMLQKLRLILQKYREVYNYELKQLAFVQIEKPTLWNCVNTIHGHSNHVFSIAVNPDGKTFASGSGDKTIKIWDVQTSELLNSLNGHSNYISSVAFSPNGEIIASGSYDKTFKLWYSFKSKTFIEHSGCVTSVAFSSDGKTFVSASLDKTIKIWDLNTEKLIYTLTNHDNYVNSVVFTPDGKKLISCDCDKTIKIWNVKTGVEMISMTDHTDAINTIAISPDGKFFATGSHDKTIKLWHLATGELIHTFLGHTDSITSLAFSPDGKNLASGSFDKTIKIWYVETKELINTLEEHSSTIHCLAFSVEGNTIFSGSADNTIKMWQRN
ncbi:WD40 repeat domain-containing protein [Anabaena cylindrica FACHB-243]|uniref:(Myosin heavy-chain) kinase n=1 Tax=Anabaena cylindrica (strain ATCC 27899 / PCC 7122) TaxID=272123 RepID=K9ZML4_ANACC|nr:MULTISPECIES: WD40 repeat domain-containing protein [Anabaena]AFZ60034.1 (Myosin heavy-chain) kinase [Anabaena cylindrica PCC 7122]MBD2417910.1 WD40 repeat domain-containing protein [Anabaena cylindrica FACHB-243]MBY5282509.1 WD40 repeat domain-containing protein [Anabaena sp. CCAP 1446/1C]MBY5307446.1 WD40 repeat domain-containing protein [Anabaena sp. CCAP 1446/1C]MCM2404827.1 WD40 repeat domain-containing protein [Anabaena sp. CCAP 1446/1C]